MANETPVNRRCYLLLDERSHFRALYKVLEKTILNAGFRIEILPDDWAGTGHRNISEVIASADCLVAEVTSPTPNTVFVLGLAQALGRTSILLQSDGSFELPTGLDQQIYIRYENSQDGLTQLSTQIGKILRDLKRFPQRARFLLGARTRNLFAVDWERLSPEDTDNLCLELMSQMGFRRVRWVKDPTEVDVVAELPKKDPDGYEYRELWLVSLGRNTPQDQLLEMALNAPADYLYHRLGRYEGQTRLSLQRQSQADLQITLLIISLRGGGISRQLDLFGSDSSSARRRSSMPNFRIRVWDQTYLTGLVYQFPQIGFKYFSDEGRARAKFRKSPEELYEEIVSLNSNLTAALAARDEEKNRRVSAERDAVWKDISFSAAHKMGNPIFAIETNLDPLTRRIDDGRKQEALRIVQKVRRSVEKAKGIVDQFKSLTSAQRIAPVPTRLRALLEESCSAPIANGVKCAIDCPPELLVWGDPERLGECFDELANNAMHWFDKPEPQIDVTASIPLADELPEQLDQSKGYTLIHFRDNGVGIPIERKPKIFDAFYSTYHHGTGLGLALVRRIVEGHGGAILESGLPGSGADFEIYLPLADNRSEAPSSVAKI